MPDQLKQQGDRIEGVSREERAIPPDLHSTAEKIEKNLAKSDQVLVIGGIALGNRVGFS
jgi:molybdopterin biosynthesis enzyme